MHFVVADGKKAKTESKKTDCKTYTHSRHLAAQMRKQATFNVFSLTFTTPTDQDRQHHRNHTHIH